MKIKKICIVGGGSSGWMTAAALSKVFSNLDITLIESKNIPILGVGESSLAEINRYLDLLDLNDSDWMPHCNASYKTSIRFTDFFDKGTYYHDNLKSPKFSIPIDNIIEFFLLSKTAPDVFHPSDLSKFMDDNYSMIEQNKFTDDYDFFKWHPKYDKAYHFDAYLFGEFLKDYVALPNGVVHKYDEINDVIINNKTGIDYITVGDEKIYADLFIDCSGFKSKLLGEGLGVEFESFGDKLINDKAIVANIEYEDKEKELTTFTNCTAIENGWLWNIPVWNRIGTGYVYSSKFADDKQALVEYKNALRKEYGDRVDDIEVRYIQFTPGFRKIPWYKNTVGIGTSCGFLEPLRSTGLLITHNNIIRLIDHLERCNLYVKNVDRQSFNHIMIDEIKHYRDFVSSHYALATRDDTEYWQHVTQDVDYFKDDTGFWKNFADVNRYYTTDFNQKFSLRVYSGAGYNPLTTVRLNDYKKHNSINWGGIDDVKTYWSNRKIDLDHYTAQLPSHFDFLKNKIYNKD